MNKGKLFAKFFEVFHQEGGTFVVFSILAQTTITSIANYKRAKGLLVRAMIFNGQC